MIKPGRVRGGADVAARVPAVAITQAVLGDRPRGARAALVDATSGRAVSYAELSATVRSAAAGLARSGIGGGDVVAVHLPDVPEIAVALHAVLAAGAVATPVRPTAHAAAMKRQLAETGARMVITWPVLLDIALEAVEDTQVERVVCFGEEPEAEPFSALLAAGDHDLGAGGGSSGGNRRAGPAEGARPLAPHSEPYADPETDPALIPYTRGTTGRPEGIRLTHHNLVTAIVQLVGAGLISAADTVLSTIPLTDVTGLVTGLHLGLYAGAAVVARPGTGRLDLLRTLRDRRVTFLLCTPDVVETLAFDREVARYGLRSLRLIVSTGAPLRPDAARACAARLRCPVRQAYGLAEAAGITHVNLRGAQEGTLDSVGRGLPWVDWRIVDPRSGAEQPSYQPGELLVRGPALARSRADGRPLPEWLPTGDAAFVDEHGRLYIIGRMTGTGPRLTDDPQALLEAHPAVREAAVIPIPDADLGLSPHAFAVLREPAAGADLLAYLNRQLPRSQQVRAVHLVPGIPRTPSGRIVRRALVQRAGLADENQQAKSPDASSQTRDTGETRDG
ncbi:MAG TPA: AMP-binding protein [Streptosporangiaceae bacterium]